MTVIAFDLDGTISDPALGITASINHALKTVGAVPHDQDRLTQYIGPPLDEIFSSLLSTKDTVIIESAVLAYRERYVSIGYTENVLYTGMRDLLSNLVQRGDKLYVATSKRPDIAKLVLEYFELTPYFLQILGCGRTRKKQELLRDILDIENASSLVMIGDRASDMNAGDAVDATCIGALWGYGSVKELQASGAEVLFQHPLEILGYLT